METLTREILKLYAGIAKGMRKIHLVVFSWVEEPQVQFSLIYESFAHRRDLFIHNIEGGVHSVVELQLILGRNAPDVEGIVLQRRAHDVS